ncbi:MAG: taurine dioxygenase [Gammaproteobacteria bacterium]|nr:taurine dioxygenase [Gammaproteobacteria bacterium]NIM73002.1 taurine dioxygenase [Gammaproteobacteria bacterium]NIN38618.1 taurine dioxygenase [Gammaproteobacteria bacterium]NIO24754.1 taurine dioxygenase [Gammaproteobacteria bacterium]NIO65357.1 taurine dioxygenase [Gammaproteobacteria bacterium]
MDYTRIRIEPLSPALGAEVSGVDLSGTLDDTLIAELRHAFLTHLVIFFRDQSLSPDRFLAFARCMGEPSEYPMVKGLDGYPEITEVIKKENERVNFGGIWHSDTTYLEKPPMGTMLLAREVPPVGGDTLFANMFLAYESLSPGLQRLLDGLTAINTSDKDIAAATRADRVRDRPGGSGQTVNSAEHPIVRTHPETGRKALYINPGHTVRIAGFSEQESAPILEYLYAQQIRVEFTCRFRWRVGSLAFWDNRAAQHYPLNDYHGYRRAMQRITLAGDRPR